MDLPANELDARVRSIWRIEWAFICLVSGAGWAAVVVENGLPGWLIALDALLVPLAILIPDIHYARWRYEIRERDVFTSHGVVTLTIALVPFDRIQYVQTRQGPLDRLFSLKRLAVHTAGGATHIPGLTIEEAERLREELSRVAGILAV